jgi:osmotically-inducible protein OsmY
VVALGDPKLCRQVTDSLQTFGIEVQSFSTAKAVKKEITGSEQALVYCGPLVRSEILSVHKNLSNKARVRNLTCFAIVPNWMNDQREREMYRQGIRMVFEWPREKEVFSSTMSQALQLGMLRVQSEDSDRSLHRAVVNRLHSQFGSVFDSLDISVYHGIVMARGPMASIGEKRRLSEFLSAIPGVRGVVDQSLYVESREVDQPIQNQAQRRLQEISGATDETLLLQVDPGQQQLTVKGTASDPRSVDKIKRSLGTVSGVKDVASEVKVSPRRHHLDQALAKKAQRIVNKLSRSPASCMKVTVVEGRAVLTGTVMSPLLASQIENAVGHLPGVVDVDSQLQVDASHEFNATSQ